MIMKDYVNSKELLNQLNWEDSNPLDKAAGFIEAVKFIRETYQDTAKLIFDTFGLTEKDINELSFSDSQYKLLMQFYVDDKDKLYKKELNIWQR